MIYLYAFIFGVFEAIWRRFHGGGLIHDWYDHCIKPWLKINYRIPSILVNSIVIFELGFGLRQLTWIQSCIFVLLVWLYWDYTFGMYMSIGQPIGREITPDDEKDYAKAWFDIILRKIFPKNMWFGPYYDFCGMWIRYTFPIVPLLFIPTFSPWMLILGFLIASCYAIENWVLDWFNAELAAGFISGVFFVLI